MAANIKWGLIYPSNAGFSLNVFQSSSPNNVFDHANHFLVNFAGSFL